MSTWSFERLDAMRVCIEQFPPFNQLAILRILHQNTSRVTLNENNYGILINMSEIPDSILIDMDNYVQYVREQERVLEDTERKKNEYKTAYFSGGD
jgi:hypothetical protein